MYKISSSTPDISLLYKTVAGENPLKGLPADYLEGERCRLEQLIPEARKTLRGAAGSSSCEPGLFNPVVSLSRETMSTVAIPGQVLGTAATHSPGPGTHMHGSKIYASIVGSVVTTAAGSKSSKPTISVPRHGSSALLPTTAKNSTLPVVGSVVLCRVTRVQQRQASLTVLLVDPAPSTPLSYPSTTNEDLQFTAVLRREDIRAYEKDKIVINDMYRVGDIVRATVISLGDERNYYVSTAGNEFGVVVASSEEGNPMVPSSWREMRDVLTGQGEARKVAKPS